MSKNKTAIFHEIRHVVSVGIAKLVSADEHLLIISEPESNQTFWYRSLEQMVNCEQLWSSTVSFLGQNSLRRNNLPCLSAPKGDMLSSPDAANILPSGELQHTRTGACLFSASVLDSWHQFTDCTINLDRLFTRRISRGLFAPFFYPLCRHLYLKSYTSNTGPVKQTYLLLWPMRKTLL